VGAGLYPARLVLGLVTAAIHYSRTPSFSEYTASYPVSEEVLDQQLPPAEPIATGNSWTAGSIDPEGLVPGKGDYERAGFALLLDLTRGKETLLSLTKEFTVTLRRSDYGSFASTKSLRRSWNGEVW
jgi:hypothetical protein